MYERIKYPQNAEAAWQATKPWLTETPLYTGDILSRLAASSPRKPLTLFIPWGVRPEGKFGDKELRALDTIKKYQSLLQTFSIPSTVLLMPADIYATEVNNYQNDSANAYFTTVTKAAEQRNFQVSPWSDIRRANRRMYDRILQGEASLEALWKTTPKSLWQSLLRAAERRSRQDPNDVAKAAFDYLKERVAEARIIDAIYKPIKVSMVSPKKDDIVDRDLARLYILPRELRFPWMPEMGVMYER